MRSVVCLWVQLGPDPVCQQVGSSGASWAGSGRQGPQEWGREEGSGPGSRGWWSMARACCGGAQCPVDGLRKTEALWVRAGVWVAASGS